MSRPAVTCMFDSVHFIYVTTAWRLCSGSGDTDADAHFPSIRSLCHLMFGNCWVNMEPDKTVAAAASPAPSDSSSSSSSSSSSQDLTDVSPRDIVLLEQDGQPGKIGWVKGVRSQQQAVKVFTCFRTHFWGADANRKLTAYDIYDRDVDFERWFQDVFFAHYVPTARSELTQCQYINSALGFARIHKQHVTGRNGALSSTWGPYNQPICKIVKFLDKTMDNARKTESQRKAERLPHPDLTRENMLAAINERDFTDASNLRSALLIELFYMPVHVAKDCIIQYAPRLQELLDIRFARGGIEDPKSNIYDPEHQTLEIRVDKNSKNADTRLSFVGTQDNPRIKFKVSTRVARLFDLTRAVCDAAGSEWVFYSTKNPAARMSLKTVLEWWFAARKQACERADIKYDRTDQSIHRARARATELALKVWASITDPETKRLYIDSVCAVHGHSLHQIIRGQYSNNFADEEQDEPASIVYMADQSKRRRVEEEPVEPEHQQPEHQQEEEEEEAQPPAADDRPSQVSDKEKKLWELITKQNELIEKLTKRIEQ